MVTAPTKEQLIQSYKEKYASILTTAVDCRDKDVGPLASKDTNPVHDGHYDTDRSSLPSRILANIFGHAYLKGMENRIEAECKVLEAKAECARKLHSW